MNLRAAKTQPTWLYFGSPDISVTWIESLNVLMIRIEYETVKTMPANWTVS